MVCSGCGAYLIDGTQKCPFCREMLVSTGKQSGSDVTYKIENKEQIDMIKKSTKAGASPAKRRANSRKKRKKKMLGYAILLAIAALFIALITLIVTLFVSLFSDGREYTTAMSSGNTLYLCYDGETVVLSETAVDLKTVSEEKNISEIIAAAGLVTASKDGKTTCFIDNYNSKTNSGTLKVMIKNDAEDIITVAENVNSSILVSDDGENILFIKNANAKGNRGELWYSNRGDEAVKIADKVDVGRFAFSKDFKKAIYIKNYNYTSKCGEAYTASLKSFTEEKLDSDVYAVYGSSNDGDTVIYAKDYDSDTKCANLYMKNDDEVIRAAMSIFEPPVWSEEGKYIFALGDKNGERYSLYRLRSDKMKSEKIVSNMSALIKASEDGEQVLYSKHFENNVADYYIWTEGETEIKVADGVNYTKNNQIGVSEDFETVAYIANYDENKKGGLLYYCEYYEDSASVAQKISEDVYSCFVLENSNIVYNKNYNATGKTAQLYIWNGIENEINPEINPRFVKVAESSVICLYDYTASGGGSLYVINEDFKESKLSTDVYGVSIKENGALLLERNKNSKSRTFDLYETDKKLTKTELVQKDVDLILKY